jgi:PAS domain S-box-containing protein
MTLREPTVLIIDDSPEDREVLRRALRDDYRIIETDLGERGLALAAELRPDCVLLDYYLPDMDALELIAARGPGHEDDYALIVLTGMADASLAVACMKQGAHDFLTKGRFTPQELRRTVAGGLDKVGLRRQLRVQQRALEASETRLRTLMQAIPDPVWLKDPDGRFLFCNPRFEALYAAAEADIIGKTDYDFVDRRTAHAFRTNDLAAMATDSATTNEEELVFARDGHVELVQTVKTPVRDARGRVIGVLGIARDITELKAAEQELERHREHLLELVDARTRSLTDERERLERILEGTRAGTWEWNIQTGATVFNERWAEIIGYRLEELAPVDIDTWMRLAHPDDLERSGELLQRHFGGELDYYECEARMRHKQGHWVWVLDRGKVVARDAEGKPLLMAGTHVDIHRTKEAELELTRAKEEAERASLAKSEFLANMSHEIRTPMNAVLGLAYLLERQPLPEEARDLARKIHDSGKSLLGIINDILDFSKIESGKIEIEHTPFRLTQVLDNLANIMTATARHKAIELVIVPPICSDWPLLGDPLRLGQILINLTNNAIKFTDAGVVEVRIEPVGVSATRLRLRFAVHDTGIGIDAAHQARLFQPFTQGDVSTTRRFGGSGLGLAISRRLVELMGGTVGLESTPGVGSSFWFELPLARAEPAADDAAEALQPAARMRVLVADDNAVVREGMLATVAALGWSGSDAATGDEALGRVLAEAALQGPDAVVLLDWRMPGRDGLATARAIREALPEPRWPLLFLLTAYPLEQLRASPDADMVEAALTKPLAPSALYAAVVRVRSRRLGAPKPKHVASLARRLAGLRLLVVDDSEINREVARRIFGDEGAQIRLAGDGQAALDWLLAHPDAVDVVLMDVQMPVMDGHEATRRIRRSPGLCGLPVVALTAGAMPAQEITAKAAGMDAFLSKPFDVDKAVAVILALARGEAPAAATADPPPAVGPADAVADADLPGLDVGRGLALWHDAEVYRRYLRKAARDYADAPARIRSGTPDAARRLAHQLKGAAANLGLDAVAACAAELERLGADAGAGERIDTAAAALQSALDTALASIRRYAPEPPAPAAAPAASAAAADPAPDPACIAPLLRAALEAFAGFDPIGAEPAVSALGPHLPDAALQPLREAIENLDATGGEAAVRALAETLGIDPEAAP